VEIGLTIAAFVTAGFVNGFLGFGAGILAMAFMTLSHDVLHAAGLVNVAGLFATTVMAWMLRKHICWREVRAMLPTGLLGVFVGVYLLGSIDGEAMTRVLGATVILIALVYLFKSTPPRIHGRGWGASAGFVGGMLQGAMNVGGPPVVAYVYGRPDPPDVAKATTQCIFLAFGTARALSAYSQGMLTEAIAWDFLAAAPASVVGLVVGMRLSQRLSPERFRRVAWVAFGLLGACLMLT